MASLLQPPCHLPPAIALQLAQQAPKLLGRPAPNQSTISLPFTGEQESPEIWTQYENLFLSCLRTRDDNSASLCLERLIKRFGATNERVMGLRGLYQEATAEDEGALTRVLTDYEKTLEEDPANMVSSNACPSSRNLAEFDIADRKTPGCLVAFTGKEERCYKCVDDTGRRLPNRC